MIKHPHILSAQRLECLPYLLINKIQIFQELLSLRRDKQVHCAPVRRAFLTVDVFFSDKFVNYARGIAHAVKHPFFDELKRAVIWILAPEYSQHVELLNGNVQVFKETGIMVIQPVYGVKQ